MPTEDITPTVFPEGEQQPQQEGQQPEVAQPEAPEYVPFKVRGQERQISASNLDALASELGANRETALMWLQSGKDYGQHVSEYRQRERELAQREAEVNAYLQRIERERQAQTPARTTSSQPTGVPQTDDPMEYLRWQSQQLLAIQQRVDEQQKSFNEEREYFKQAMAQHERQRIEGEIVETWGAFEKELKAKNLPVIPYEDIEREAMLTGLAYNTKLPLKEVFQRAYRNLAWDDVQSSVEKTTMQKLRDPRATVTVPGGSSAPSPQKPQGSDIERALGSMKMGEVIDFIPERR